MTLKDMACNIAYDEHGATEVTGAHSKDDVSLILETDVGDVELRMFAYPEPDKIEDMVWEVQHNL